MAEPVASEAEIVRLGACLSFAADPAARAALRADLLGGGFEPAFRLAGRLRLVPALAMALGEKGLLPPFPLPGGPAAAARQALAAHAAERAAFAATLAGILAILNRQGIAPILIKGARAVWTGTPPWRSLRDLDLLAPGRADAAEAALRAAGFATHPAARERRTHHHAPPLVRAGVPGWVEIHGRAGNHYAEKLLPTAALAAAARPEEDGRGRVRLLAPAHHLLLGLVHHHVGHSAYARGTLDLKGLYEFAAEFRAADAATLAALADCAAAHPRLAAALDLWLAAAADLYGLAVPPPFRLCEDAAARWRRARARMAAPAAAKYPGYGEEIAMAVARHRLAALPGGGGPAGRQALRLGVLASLLPRSPLAALRRGRRP